MDRAGYGMCGGGGGEGFSYIYRNKLSLDSKQSRDSAVTTSWARLFQSDMVWGRNNICLYCVLQDEMS